MEDCWICEKPSKTKCSFCGKSICSQECMDKHNEMLEGEFIGELVDENE